ncbi:hypothetical protein ACP4OV_001570 [Aristida adscensionis]
MNDGGVGLLDSLLLFTGEGDNGGVGSAVVTAVTSLASQIILTSQYKVDRDKFDDGICDLITLDEVANSKHGCNQNYSRIDPATCLKAAALVQKFLQHFSPF